MLLENLNCQHIPTIFLEKKKIEDLDLSLKEPFMLAGAASDWPAMHIWTDDYFRRKFGNLNLQAKRRIDGEYQTKVFTLSDYLGYMEQEWDAPFYLTDCKFHLGTDMERHYWPPNIFTCWYREIPASKRKNTLSWLYIGAKNTYSRLHLDIWNTSAWNTVVTGSKLWLFFPLSDQKYLYDGEVNPFNVDQDRYPLFKNARPMVCLQSPGDIVFTPSNWWHAVYNLEKGVSITENFINESNYKEVLAYFELRNNKSYQSLREIVDNKINNHHDKSSQ